MIELIEEYVFNITNTDEFKRLMKLKDIIDIELKDLIVSFKNHEAKYLEALKYQDYYPGFDKIKRDFVNAKAKLYSNSYVKEYFSLERKIQGMINNDFDEIKKSISNKLAKNLEFNKI